VLEITPLAAVEAYLGARSVLFQDRVEAWHRTLSVSPGRREDWAQRSPHLLAGLCSWPTALASCRASLSENPLIAIER